MATHPGCLIAYDADGNVVATLDHCIQADDDGRVLGLVDFAGHEEAGGEHLAIWEVSNATGSKVWPEWLGAQAHQFRVELVGPPGRKRIAALVHRASGIRRERAQVEGAIAARIAAADGGPADIRDLVGGPDRPLVLGADGRTLRRTPRKRPALPVVESRPSARDE